MALIAAVEWHRYEEPGISLHIFEVSSTLVQTNQPCRVRIKDPIAAYLEAWPLKGCKRHEAEHKLDIAAVMSYLNVNRTRLFSRKEPKTIGHS